MNLSLPLLALSVFGPSLGCAAALDMPSNISRRAEEAFNDTQTRELAEAAARGNIRDMERLVKAGANVNARGSLGITPAWWAIRNRNKTGFEWLLKHGADPNPEVESITILEMAAGYEDSGFLEIALRYKPNINKASRYTGHTPLSTAVVYSRLHNLELLIQAGVNMSDDRGQSPLAFAAGQSRYHFVYLMLKAGASFDRQIPDGPNKGKNELAFAIANRLLDPNMEGFEWRERVIRFLREKGIDAQPPPNEGNRTKPLPVDLR